MNGLRYRRGQQRSALLWDVPQLTLPHEPPGYKHTYYLYTCLVPPEWAGAKRDRVMALLQDEYRVGSLVLNRPTHQSRAFVRQHTLGQELPLSEELGARLFCPSLHALMSQEDNEYVAAALDAAVAQVAQEG
jgi:dTDP-4-amino-4,6-dideoxygalactose transaminase